MILFSYKIFQIFLCPIIILIGILRIIKKKETLLSFKQKVFNQHNFIELSKFEIMIHFASIGEFNSIKFLIRNFSEENFFLSCTTLSSYYLAKNTYPNYKIIFLPLDFFWNVEKFISNLKLKKIIWVDSEIWPNWLSISKSSNIKNIVVNARLSDKSYNRWKFFPVFSKFIGLKYDLVFAKSILDQVKFDEIFNLKSLYYGNLKFDQIVDIPDFKKPIICFASIHKNEFAKINQILSMIDLNLIEEIIIIPRHIQYIPKLEKELDSKIKSKVYIHNKFGDNLLLFSKSKIVFMGGSLIEHGGQNPLEALSKGCFILTGIYNKNFKDIYDDLLEMKLCEIFKVDDLSHIGHKINGLICQERHLSDTIKKYFITQQSQLMNIIKEIESC